MAQPVYNNELNYSLNDSSSGMQIRLTTAATTRKLHSGSTNQRPICQLESNERLAAYLVHEPHVGAILRLLLEMSEEQRRMSLTLMQCVGLGGGAPVPVPRAE